MYGLFTYIWLKFMVNVGKYTIHILWVIETSTKKSIPSQLPIGSNGAANSLIMHFSDWSASFVEPNLGVVTRIQPLKNHGPYKTQAWRKTSNKFDATRCALTQIFSIFQWCEEHVPKGTLKWGMFFQFLQSWSAKHLQMLAKKVRRLERCQAQVV